MITIEGWSQTPSQNTIVNPAYPQTDVTDNNYPSQLNDVMRAIIAAAVEFREVFNLIPFPWPAEIKDVPVATERIPGRVRLAGDRDIELLSDECALPVAKLDEWRATEDRAGLMAKASLAGELGDTDEGFITAAGLMRRQATTQAAGSFRLVNPNVFDVTDNENVVSPRWWNNFYAQMGYWTSEDNYYLPRLVFGSDDRLYKTLQDSGPDTVAGLQDPVKSPTYWQIIPEV